MLPYEVQRVPAALSKRETRAAWWETNGRISPHAHFLSHRDAGRRHQGTTGGVLRRERRGYTGRAHQVRAVQ